MKTGEVIHWVVVDEETGELCVLCDSRQEARDLIREANSGRVAKVVVA